MPVVVPAQLSNILDYGRWKYETDCSAICFSLYTLLNKMLNTLGGALGLAIAGWYGFDASTREQSASAIFGMNMGIAWVPLIILSIAAVVVKGIPITNRQHATILRRLDGRTALSVSTVPVSG